MSRVTTRTLALALVSAPAAAQLAALPVGGPFEAPTFVTAEANDATRLYVGELDGRVLVIRDGVTLAEPFLDLRAKTASGGERGLFDLAFHLEPATDGRLFVSYTDLAGDSVVESYLRDGVDPERADPSSAVTIFGPLAQPFANHNGGSLGFGGDGMLYLALGDGGAPADAANPAQDPLSLLGKLLRFDVDLPYPHVPPDNPFVGDPSTRDEIWALGLRNPWRTSFDRATGDLWIADVGQWTYEEVDFQPQSSAGGENYGWPCMEGAECSGFGGCTCGDAALTPPVHIYDHADGCSITGGHRYRGAALPDFVGRYFFADYCSGRVWSFAFDGAASSDLIEHTDDLAIPGAEAFASVGEDAHGELYLVDQIGGELWKIVPDWPAPVSYCETSPNSVGRGARIGSNGVTSVALNDFQLTASGAVPGQMGLFYYGPEQIQLPLGEGLRCVDGGGVGTYRLYPPAAADGAGQYARQVDFERPPANGGAGAIAPGARWNFQLWYRDPAGGAAGFNLSDALEVLFCP